MAPGAAWFAVELAAIAAVAIAPVPAPVVWLLVIASVSMWARGKSWGLSSELGAPPPPPELVPIGVVCGAAALIAALALSAPLADLTGRAVEWSQYAIVRGSPNGFIAIAIVVAAQAIAIELALRGWLVPRVLELAPRATTLVAAPVVAALVSALAEAAVTRGHLAARAGAFALGLGSAILYLGAGRRLAAPLACRLTFELSAVLLAALRIIG